MNNFKIGQTVMTYAIAEMMRTDKNFALFVNMSFNRYLNCDWGSMDDEDKALNDAAVKNGDERIHAAYIDSTGRKIWIITEWDRSVTTILFPSDY
jgi:hypothetical protein